MAKKPPRRWSGRVTRESHALALERQGVRQAHAAGDRAVAEALGRTQPGAQERAFRSAMSMLNFYINRAGDKLPPRGSNVPRTSCGRCTKGRRMPEKRTIERARKDAREGKTPSTQAGEFVREEIHHVREGKHGARSTKQAIAIGLSKARRAGVKLPRRPGNNDPGPRRSAPDPERSRSAERALRREPHRAASGARRPGASQRRAARRRGAQGRREEGSADKGPGARRQAARKAAQTRARRR